MTGGAARRNLAVLSGNCAEAVSGRIGQFRFVDYQRAVVSFGRVSRPVARFEVGNQLVSEGVGSNPGNSRGLRDGAPHHVPSGGLEVGAKIQHVLTAASRPAHTASLQARLDDVLGR